MRNKLFTLVIIGAFLATGAFSAATEAQAAAPSFTLVKPFPLSGVLTSGDIMYINFSAAGDEADLTLTGPCTVNNVVVNPTIQNYGNGAYQVVYTVSAGDTNRAPGEIPIDCTFQNPAAETVHVTSMMANTLSVDAGTATPPADVTAPVITVTAPADGATYALNGTIAADYSCSDSGSGVAACVGTVPSGSAIDTGTAGLHAFTVNASDVDGNATSTTVHYNVALYSTVSFSAPSNLSSKTFSKTNTIPVKFQVPDGNGGFVSTAVARLYIDKNPFPTTSAVPTGGANTANYFRYDPSTHQYIYNLALSKVFTTAGTYYLRVHLDDGSDTSINIQVTK
jgi:hypothetical protein